jgi:hypothetical protein
LRISTSLGISDKSNLRNDLKRRFRSPFGCCASPCAPSFRRGFDSKIEGGADAIGCFLVEVEGKKAGDAMTYILYRIFTMGENLKKFGTAWVEVAVPVSVLTCLLSRRKIGLKGVAPPERLEPKTFLNELVKSGITFQEKIIKKADGHVLNR